MDLSTTEALIDGLFKRPVVWAAYALALENSEIFDKLRASERFQEAPQLHGKLVVTGWTIALKTAARVVNPGREQHIKFAVDPELYFAVGNTLTVLAVRDLAASLPPRSVIPRHAMDGLMDAFEQVMAANGSTQAAGMSWPSLEAQVDDMMWTLRPERAEWFWKNVIGRLPDSTEVARGLTEVFARRTPPHVLEAYAIPYHELCEERFF